MQLDIPCKTGKIQITDDGVLRIQAPFKKTLWQVPCADVTGFTVQPSVIMMVTLTIHTTTGNYTAETVTKQNAEKLQALFPNLQTQSAGREWWHSPTLLTHVATYTKEKDMQREVEMAAQFGWMIQGQSGQGGHVNVGRTAGKLLLTGGLGLLTGVSRSKDKTTITFVRTPEWIAAHQQR